MGYTTTPQQCQRKPTREEKTCYNCYKLGHWHENCPKGRISSSSDQQLIFRSRMRFLGFDELSEFQAVILCDCGESRRPLISRSQKNPGRQYYSECSCGRSRFRWADVVEPEEKIWVPKCKCKAGFCRVCVQRNGPDTGRYFFKCCISEGQGQCEFRQLVDDTVLQTPMIYDEDETLNNCSTTDVGTGNDNKAVMDTAGVPLLRTPPQNLRSASPPPPPSSSASGPSKRRKRLVIDNELFEEEEEEAGSAGSEHKKNGKRLCYGDNSFPGEMDSCFYCGEFGHLGKKCHLKDLSCILGCPNKMILRKSGQPHSLHCRFLVCRGQPQCKAFQWVDVPVKQKENTRATTQAGTQASTSRNSQADAIMKVTIEENDKKITIEGLVDDVIEVINKNLFL